MTDKTDNTPALLGLGCVVVGVLAALGKFNSIMNFPVIFAGTCLMFGLFALGRRHQHRPTLQAAVLVIGALSAVAGWLYQQQAIEARLADRTAHVLTAVRGTRVPPPLGLDPLNTDITAWNEAAAFDSTATIVTFWARWCSPCVKEMPELEELYREYGDRGLQVLAITQYDDPRDEDKRRSDFDKAVAFLDQRELTFPAAITDRADIYQAFSAQSIPTTALIDEHGEVVDYALGLDQARALMDRAEAMVKTNAAGVGAD